MFPKYDVIVVGAGHAGCEAAAAAANLGSKVLLVTMNMNTIAQMSCNPAMGGIAKGQIVREIDAMGGYSGIVSDETMLQFRMLNRSKGPAMWSPRVQSDRMLFAAKWRHMLEQTSNVDFWQEMVTGIIVEDNIACGIKTSLGINIYSKSVILTNGTFLNGVIHIGHKQFGGGRAAEKAATGITEQLVGLGFEAGRMKTGTPPRLDARTIDYTKTEEQKGDEEIVGFSYTETKKPIANHSCFITYTNKKVHDILKSGFDSSPMFSGRIQGTGPRYCPSIEDKVDRFAERERHQLFIEPEGANTVEIYLNGFSSSLSEDIQYKALKNIPGFENIKMFRPGYAIEYDFFQPTQLHLSLETKLIKNLFFAGQINGTTGYEEAAAQGLMAGINAHQAIHEKNAVILNRSEAYIGVLIDDLVNKGTEEPYRMFTSRAEFRLLLRQDNADLRLTALSHQIGLASKARLDKVKEKEKAIAHIQEYIATENVTAKAIQNYLEQIDSSPLSESIKIEKLLLRPDVSLIELANELPKLKQFLAAFKKEEIEGAEIASKYKGYIHKEQETVDKMLRLENIFIRADIDYKQLGSLSTEAKEKLTKIKPKTIGQASRISGVSPSDIAVLMVYMGR